MMRIRRAEFLRLIATCAVARRVVGASPQQTTVGEGADLFVGRVTEDLAAALRCALCAIGDQLGIFKAMATAGPLTAAELAHKTQLNARMLREWLNAMATARYVEYRPGDKTYLLSKAHAQVLADEESSPMFLGGVFELLVPLVSAAPKVAHAFLTGQPVAMSDVLAGVEGGRAFAPAFKHELVQKWIPLLPRVQEALIGGATAVDVACGEGVASIVLAKAFPKSQFSGYDPDTRSIRKARENAEKAGVADRVRFVAAGSSKLPPGAYDLLTIFNSVHHFDDPVTILSECRRALRAGGTCFIVDEDLSLNPEENMNTTGRLAYPITTLYCLQDSMANNGAGLGAEFNEQVLKDLSAKSGFSQCRKLPGSAPGRAYYELHS